ESMAAIPRDCSATRRSVSSPYRCWLPVRNQTSKSSWAFGVVISAVLLRSAAEVLGGLPGERDGLGGVLRDLAAGTGPWPGHARSACAERQDCRQVPGPSPGRLAWGFP